MDRVSLEKLKKISGGATISGTIISAFTGLVKVLYDAGCSVGEAIRRIVDGELCPLKWYGINIQEYLEFY